MQAGISTLGITFGFGVEATAGTKPTTFKQLHRINSLGGVNIEPEQIDASALEDGVTRYVAGRADTGGSFPVGVNRTNETIEEWKDLIAAYKGLTGGKRMWFEIITPGIEDAEFIVAQPPLKLPIGEKNQNELNVMEINLTIEDVPDETTAVPFTGTEA